MLDGKCRWHCLGCPRWRHGSSAGGGSSSAGGGSSSAGGGSTLRLSPHGNQCFHNVVKVSRVGLKIIRSCQRAKENAFLPVLFERSATELELSDSPNAVSSVGTCNARAMSRKDGNIVRSHCLDCLGSQWDWAGTSPPGSGAVSSRAIGLESRNLGQYNHESHNLLVDVESFIRFRENLRERRRELGQIMPGRR